MLEPLPWPGNPDRPIDDTNSGKYLFEVRDRATNRTIHSRGFSSIYGEWETTSEAKESNRTFSESFRFPAPKGPVQIVLKKRDSKSNLFREIWTFAVDPKDKFVETSTSTSGGSFHRRRSRGSRGPRPVCTSAPRWARPMTASRRRPIRAS